MRGPENQAKQDERMRRYLLGELSEEEQVELEQRFFADEDLHEQLLAVEDELRYDYAQGVLNRKQREQFEKRFLNTPEARMRVATAKDILNRAFERAPAPAVEGKSRLRSALDWVTFRGAGSGFRLSYVGAAATVACVISVWSLWQMDKLRDQLFHSEEQRIAAARQATTQEDLRNRAVKDLEEERARRSQLEQQLSERKPTQFLAFLLTPGLTRDVEGGKRLIVSPGVDSVRLELQLRRTDLRQWRAELLTLEGDQLWSQPVSISGGKAVLTVPARILRPGDYSIEVKGIGSTGELELAGDYYFTAVERR